MKALIFNSGRGIRMGKMTEFRPKCMVELYNSETIFERQIRILSSCGIKDFVITTGPFAEQLHEVASKYPYLHFTFVPNPIYDKTNYIVSMDNARDYLDDDFLLLHGDLVFNRNLVIKMLEDVRPSICLYNEKKNLPEKDFKGRFKDNKLKEVSINIFDSDCYAFQPLYKLSKKDLNLWKEKVHEFVEKGITNVYAENALNEISDKLNIIGISYSDDYIDEIDNENDYKRVREEIKYYDFREQEVYESDDYVKTLHKVLKKNEKIFFVCSKRISSEVDLSFKDYDKKIFTDFSSNPTYEEVKLGVQQFKKDKYNIVVAIGGGSAIDTAKCIKLFSGLDNALDFLNKKYKYQNIPLIAIPTTAGTGSESTSFAVIYYKNEKFSVDHGSIYPNKIILDKNILKTLPLYQKKVTLLDSICQAIESLWSKGSNIKSIEYAKKSLELIEDNYKNYLNEDEKTYKDILTAANLSGRAINITRTTAPHAMSYKLTKLYNIPHGYAVALTIIPVWEKLLKYSKKDKELETKLLKIANIFKAKTIEESILKVREIISYMKLDKVEIKDKDISILLESVNEERLKNSPVIFSKEEIREIYEKIKDF